MENKVIDINKVEALINSLVPAYQIEKETGVTRAQIGNYRKENGQNIMNMSLANALKLQNYYEEMENMNLKTYISKQKSFSTYRLDAEKLEDSKFGDVANKLIKGIHTESDLLEANELVNNVLNVKDGKIFGGIRLWFDAVAIQNEDLCQKYEQSLMDKVRERGTVLQIAELTEYGDEEFLKNHPEYIETNYDEKMRELEKESAHTIFPHVTVYENKEDLLKRNSGNMGDAEEVEETYNYLKEELDYLSDETPVYSIDRGNGLPEYYDDAKEAYESF